MKITQSQSQSATTDYKWGDCLLGAKPSGDLIILKKDAIIRVEPHLSEYLHVFLIDGSQVTIDGLLDNGDLDDMLFRMTQLTIESEG